MPKAGVEKGPPKGTEVMNIMKRTKHSKKPLFLKILQRKWRQTREVLLLSDQANNLTFNRIAEGIRVESGPWESFKSQLLLGSNLDLVFGLGMGFTLKPPMAIFLVEKKCNQASFLVSSQV